jgi:hypothetical protein
VTKLQVIGLLALLSLAIVWMWRGRVIRASLVTRVHDREAFWRVRRRFQNWAFAIAKARYRIRFRKERSTRTARVSWHFARRAAAAAVLAVLVIVLTYRLEDFLLNVIEESRWVGKHLSWLSELAARKELVGAGLYTAVLGTSIGVLGVFIALFSGAFTTSSDVLSARVALTARQLLLRDPQVSFIARLFSFTVMLSLVLLFAAGAGARPTLLGMLLVMSLTGLAVLVAALLVRQGFYFLNPSRLALVPLHDMLRSALLATPTGFRFMDPNFQNSYRTWANSSLNEAQILWRSELQARPLQEDNLASIERTILRFINSYLKVKQKIPPSSHWHTREPKHKEWYLAPHTQVEMAAATDTPLQPDLEPNRFWVEDAVLSLLVSSVTASLAEGTGAGAISVMNDVSDVVENFGQEWETDYARKWITALGPVVFDLVGTEWQPTPDVLNQKDDYRLALIDAVALLPVATLLGVMNAARGTDIGSLLARIHRLKWRSDFYDLRLPHKGRETAEDLQRRIGFELGTRDDPVTPPWYAGQLIIRALGQQLADDLQLLKDIPDEFYRPQADLAIEARQFVVAATILGRAIEFCHKFIANLDAVETFSRNLDEAKVLTDLPWAEFNLEELKETLEATRLRLLESFVSCIPGLYVAERPSNWPDLFGRAVHTAGDMCLEAAIGQREETLKKAFSAYLLGILGVFDRLRAQLSGHDPQWGMTWATDPLLDLFDISGYVILMSELHQNPALWKACRQAWEHYFSTIDPTQALQIFAAVTSFDEGLFLIRPRAIIRTTWKMRIERVLDDVPQRYVERDVIGYQVADHPSPLIRVFAREGRIGSMFDGTNIFVELYLPNLPAAAGLSFRERGHLLNSLHHRDDDERTETTALLERIMGRDEPQ